MKSFPRVASRLALEANLCEKRVILFLFFLLKKLFCKEDRGNPCVKRLLMLYYQGSRLNGLPSPSGIPTKIWGRGRGKKRYIKAAQRNIPESKGAVLPIQFNAMGISSTRGVGPCGRVSDATSLRDEPTHTFLLSVRLVELWMKKGRRREARKEHQVSYSYSQASLR